MSDMNTKSLANKLQDLESFIKSQNGREVGYGRALREAILSMDNYIEVEVLKCLGDLHLQKGRLGKDSAEFDKAAALYTAALLRCRDSDMDQTLGHRVCYMEKLSSQLLQGYAPLYQWLPPENVGISNISVLRVAETCYNLDRNAKKSWRLALEAYTETLVLAIATGDMFLEFEVLKSLGDLYLTKAKAASDAAQFSKATTMYNRSLIKCEDAETKLTLLHRIKYTEKIKKIRTKQPSPQKSAASERTPYLGQQSGDITISSKGTAETAEGRRITESQYKDHLKKGESSLARAHLDSAEKHFAAALKMVHARDPTAQQYQREVEPLCKLGDVYSKRGQQTGDGGDFVKAAALYNAAIARSKNEAINGNIETDIREVHKSFIKFILDIECDVSPDTIEKHKKQLKEMRDQIKLEMETIDQQLDPYVHDEDDPCVREIEAKRAHAVRQLFDKIAQQRKAFISQLVKECIGLMGPPPCNYKYALIGLGSQATGLVTPYSDLEFAILVEHQSEECLVYFRKLTHYLHLKVVNLGETILPALGIQSLNDFYSKNPEGNWYYDSVTPRGFAFDGAMPKASKTPLGQQGSVVGKPSELICTPENMASKLQTDVTMYLKERYHLATILRNPSFMVGDQDLVDRYMEITEKILKADGGKMLLQLAQETVKENIQSRSDKENMLARMVDVKKELYRFPAVALDCLALSSAIMPTTVWRTIEEMENQQVISPNNAHHLTVLTSISAELRLRTYMANGGQRENLSAMTGVETVLSGRDQISKEEQTMSLKRVFHLPNEKQIFRYYLTAVPLRRALSTWSCNKPVRDSLPDLYNNSSRARGKMYFELCKYDKAISCYEESLKKSESSHELDRITLLSNLGDAWYRMGNCQRAICCIEEAMQMHRNFLSQNAVQPISASGAARMKEGMAGSLNILAEAWVRLGDNRKAVEYAQQALHTYKSAYGESAAHPGIALSLNILGTALENLCEYRRALLYMEQALQIHKCYYGQNRAHRNIANALNNLGKVWGNLGDHRKAVEYEEQSLQMKLSYYGQTTAHPDIVLSLKNTGVSWLTLDDPKKAMSYFKQALQMSRNMHGLTDSEAHPDIAWYLNHLGIAYEKLGEYQQAITNHEQALTMYRSTYGRGTAHPDIASTFNYLGLVWDSVGDPRKAVSYHEKALQMKISIYDKGKPHSDIAMSLTNLGQVLSKLGDHRRAICYHEQALQIDKHIHGQSTVHPDIALSLSNLGQAWNGLGDNRRAISFLDQALKMYRSIHRLDTAHHDVANVLNNLGGAWSGLGDCRQAITYYEQALQITRSIHGQNKAHPNIATLLEHLGGAWHSLGDHRKAIDYFEKALQVNRSLYGPVHPYIVSILCNLGALWYNLCDYIKSISYCEESLQMHKALNGERAATHDMVKLLNALGLAYYFIDDHERSLSTFKEAFAMARRIEPEDQRNRLISETDFNFAFVEVAISVNKK
ncbi:uncharacterized protein LOC144911178 [Branchiostoma floridae x Branchiostoma belcheri]